MNTKFCPFNSPSHECNDNCVFHDHEHKGCNLASNAETNMTDIHFLLHKLNSIVESLHKELINPEIPPQFK